MMEIQIDKLLILIIIISTVLISPKIFSIIEGYNEECKNICEENNLPHRGREDDTCYCGNDANTTFKLSNYVFPTY